MQPDYIRKLHEAIRAVHGCESVYSETVPVVEIFQGKVAWEGDVEVFSITGHPRAKRCFAWGYEDSGTLRTTAVLELPPVDSPETAVKVAIAAAGRK